MRELTIRKIEVREVSGQESEPAMLGEVGSLPVEGVDASGQDRRLQPQPESLLGMTKTFEQPTANEARSSGEEQASAIEIKKIIPGKINDRFEIPRKGPAPSFHRR